MSDLIVGIDLGTTNSEIAAFVGGEVQVLGPGTKMLPSCVGFSPTGDLLVGEAARNQQLLYPERTVRSIKRRMGSSETVELGGKAFSPQEISAIILRELMEWARKALGQAVSRAVITVPAYFSDAQRNATREAGAIAGLEVVRILNEPTAASLAYGFSDGKRHTAMVYDLGGGTFDVSIVMVEGDVTEVLASHGNNHLGGDDFDDLRLERLEREFQQEHGIDLRHGHPAAHARLWWAAEEAKKKLSFEPFARIREETLATDRGKPLHLDLEINREEYEAMIRPLSESTLESVSKALTDAGKSPGELDAIVLVGGATRTPLIARLLQDRTGIEPKQDVHPDLCVALGAGVLASRLAGHDIERVLVDVSPFSFGPSYLGERGGFPYMHCYHPIIKRNTPLPITRSDAYMTSHANQTQVDVQIYQGEDEDALKNILVGEFAIKGLKAIDGPNEVVCRMSLDVDGILHVTAIEKATGKSKHITISNALRAKTPQEIAAAQDRIRELYSSRAGVEEDLMEDVYDLAPAEIAEEEPPVTIRSANGKNAKAREEAMTLVDRSRGLFGKMHSEDVEEAVGLHEKIDAALSSGDEKALSDATTALKELLFFVEGS